jgi:hypothetical protein
MCAVGLNRMKYLGCDGPDVALISWRDKTHAPVCVSHLEWFCDQADRIDQRVDVPDSITSIIWLPQPQVA